MIRRTQRVTPLVLAAALATAACGSDDDKSCDVAKQTGCGTGLVCEPVEGGSSVCAQPVVITGNVFDLATAVGLEKARVVALDANRSPISTVAITDAAGDFSIQVANPRTKDGKPVARDVFLRADAQGYATFPSGIRQAVPVSTAGGVSVDGKLVVADPQTTDIGLIELPAAGTGTISGTAAVPANQPGVLVVAESPAGEGFSALADRNGDYAIFNLAPGDYTVQAYARGAVHPPADATVIADQATDVDLAIASGSTGTKVSGQVSLVNRGAGTGTSVILVVESTFDPDLLRGETPPGLRAPGPGVAPDLDGAWEIAGVPPGRYVALAAFENDFLVRDPDVCQGGTEIVHFDVAGAPVSLDTFKITGSLDVISPGAAGPELVTSATPTFSWKDDSSETAYELTVIDALGNTVWTFLERSHSGDDPAVQYAGPALEPGYYQFKVKSVKGMCTPTGSTTEVTQYISQTEDLKGVFIVP